MPEADQSMAQASTTTASAILNRLSVEERHAAILDVVRSLQSASRADILFASSLLSEHSNETAGLELFTLLQQWVRQGRIEDVSKILRSSINIREKLLAAAIQHLHHTVESLKALPRDQGMVVPLDETGSPLNGFTNELSLDIVGLASAVQYLRLCSEFLLEMLDKDVEQAGQVFRLAVDLLGARDHGIVGAAREIIMVLLSTDSVSVESNSALMWQRISTMCGAVDWPFHQTIGFQIWLQCIPIKFGALIIRVNEEMYWHLLAVGLRQGDSEKRKLCLHILRKSVSLGFVPAGSRIAPAKSRMVKDFSFQNQYDRYCVVFETIILGRYLNQIQECRPDLDNMFSNHSVIGAPWIKALVASAMDTVMQDSNRKFMGTWFLGTVLPMDDMTEAMQDILEHDFLPWATQGFLFTSSLRESDQRAFCAHGDELAAWITRSLLAGSTNNLGKAEFLNALLTHLLQHKTSMFIYAAIYVIEGIGRAFEQHDFLLLNRGHIETLLELSSWDRLFEINRDLVLLRISKLCTNAFQSDPFLRSSLSATSASKLEQLDDATSGLRGIPPKHSKGEVTEKVQSRRSANEQKAIVQCEEMLSIATAGISGEAEMLNLHDILLDLINEMDYLEYPKSLVLRMIPTVLNPLFISVALQSNGEAMSATIMKLVWNLLAATKNRIYLLAPVLIGLRSVILNVPSVGSFLPLEDIIVRFAEDPPMPKVEPLLEDSVSQLLSAVTNGTLKYENYYGNRESVGFAAFIDLIARMGESHSQLLRGIIDRLLVRWSSQTPPVPTHSKWKTTIQLQTILLSNEAVLKHGKLEEAEDLLRKIHQLLVIEPLPRLRYLLEWMIARIYTEQPALRDGILDMLGTKDHHSNPKYLASLTEIATRLACSSSANEAFAARLAMNLVVLSASSKVIIRHEAQWSFPVLWDHAQNKGWKLITANAAYAALDEYIRSLPRFGDPPMDRQLSSLDLDTDHTLTNLVEGGYISLEPFEKPLTSRNDLLKLYELDAQAKLELPPACLPLGHPLPYRIKAETDSGNNTTKPQAQESVVQSSTTSDVALALQTKGTAYLSTIVSSTADASAPRRKAHEVMVVASLIDNPYNLGGLSRASEIFGASALLVTDPRVTSNKLFTSVSVASHLHLPILPLTEEDTPGWLREKRAEAWTVVGIEQTDRSVLLGDEDAKLPAKTILVLGSEREGIPAAVLLECDVLVEIPQQGVTRSLNVQTAASIVLCEYARQHRGVK